jgi:hypothetical protein
MPKIQKNVEKSENPKNFIKNLKIYKKIEEKMLFFQKKTENFRKKS